MPSSSLKPFSPENGKCVLDVAAAAVVLRVVRELVLLVVAQAKVFAREAELAPPVVSGSSRQKWYQSFASLGWHEELELHLLELARAEDEVPRRDLVAESACRPGDAERHLHARRVEHVLEVVEHPLRRLGPEIGLALLVDAGADVGLEHQVELPRLGERPAADRAWDHELAPAARQQLEQALHAPIGRRVLVEWDDPCLDRRRVTHREQPRRELFALVLDPFPERRRGDRIFFEHVQQRVHPLAFLVEERPDLVGAMAGLQCLQSCIGSAKPATWPLASHTLGWLMIEQSRPTMSSSLPSGPVGGASTMSRHQRSRMLFLSSTPSGP